MSSLSEIRRYEQGIARPTGATVVRKLALTYGKPLSWFNLDASDNPPPVETLSMDEAMRTYMLARPDLTPLSLKTIANFILFTYQQQIKRYRERDACASAA